MTRILLISGVLLASEDTLRRRVLRFTGSRRATRSILARIESARRLGRIMSCLVLPDESTAAGAEPRWHVQFSFTDYPATGAMHA